MCFENFINDSETQLKNLFDLLGIKVFDAQLKSLIVRPHVGKWKNYAEDEWFAYHEAVCEENFKKYITAA
jgi:hypothetical protein